MCGIAGFTHLKGRAEAGRIQRATATIHHRGPNQTGVWESDTVSLGAVRLSIIDLAGGDQPIVSDNGDAVIVFNGEVYNHNEVRVELEKLGHKFRSRCDTEVVLKAFQQWDTECFTRFHGMFAVAIWMETDRRLVLARDRTGIKPLYLYSRENDLYFGSEMKVLFEHSEIPRRLSLTGLNYFLSLNYIPTPHTLVEGITKLEPGHWLEWRSGRITKGAYWKLPCGVDSSWTLDSAKEALDGLLKASMKEHLIADVPLGIWASGGVDSSAILHYASQISGRKLKTFSVSFLGRKFDESPYFRMLAEKYETDHHEFDLNPDVELVPAIEKMAWHSDEPSADAGALPVWFLARMSRQHVTVALSGEGADELFGGYYTYLADRYAGWMRAVPRPFRQLALAATNLLPVSDDKISLEYKLKRFLKGSLLDAGSAHLFWNGTFTAAERAQLLSAGSFKPTVDLFSTIAPEYLASGKLNPFIFLDQHYYLVDDILYKCDRMSMAHSLEVRPPFLDHRIVEFAASLPESFKINGSGLKYILKETLRGKLPEPILNRRKEGFDIPAHDWFRTALKPLITDTLTPQAVGDCGLFRPSAISKLMDDHFARRANYGYHLWGLLTLFLWMKQWKITVGDARTTN